MTSVRPLAPADLPEAQRIVRAAFGTFFGAPDLDTFWTDRDYVYGRHGAEHTVSFAVDADDGLAGSNFATRWGSVGFFGPLSVRPDLWNAGVGQQLEGSKNRWHFGAVADSVGWGMGDRQWQCSRGFSTLMSG